ncbi:hypothetical protein PsalN5692_02300 [Piscirickettsia salmonis]|uniref:hypothetical protein n=1 Tax=Piscirickettsia salmonis TaxID=1238 RepID=UPI0012B92332|nr:hypothetical protein [Piscirickettsia salmonis]QGP50827.1 hypothetical protein PsalN5692_02300 [Piscirickettsia salmonis]
MSNKIKETPLSDLVSLYYDIKGDSFKKSHPLYWVLQKESAANPLKNSKTWKAAIDLVKDKIAKKVKTVKQENSIGSSSSIIEIKAFNAAVDILDEHNINLDTPVDLSNSQSAYLMFEKNGPSNPTNESMLSL